MKNEQERLAILHAERDSLLRDLEDLIGPEETKMVHDKMREHAQKYAKAVSQLVSQTTSRERLRRRTGTAADGKDSVVKRLVLRALRRTCIGEQSNKEEGESRHCATIHTRNDEKKIRPEDFVQIGIEGRARSA